MCIKDLIKFPYFADTIERGYREGKEAQRQGDFTDTSNVHSLLSGYFWRSYAFFCHLLDVSKDSAVLAYNELSSMKRKLSFERRLKANRCANLWPEMAKFYSSLLQ